MSVWAHPCIRCGDASKVYYVSHSTIAEIPDTVRIVQVKVGKKWLCALLDREQRVAVDGNLIRQVVATDAQDCESCGDA